MERAINLSDLYQLMAISFRYPTKELVEGLLDGTFIVDAADCLEALGASETEVDELCGALMEAARREAGMEPGDEVSEEAVACLLKKLRVEYTGLFLVPMREKIYIHESRFCYPADADPAGYSMFVSPCALHVEQMYKEAGVRVRKNLQEPSDHLATELEFVSYLYRKWAEDLASEGGKEKLWQWRVKEFRTQHLVKWIEAFMGRLSETSELDTYRVLARLGGMTFHVSGDSR